eukprot:547458-Rhodomonas_salina.1
MTPISTLLSFSSETQTDRQTDRQTDTDTASPPSPPRPSAPPLCWRIQREIEIEKPPVDVLLHVEGV